MADLTDVVWSEFPLRTAPDDRVSANFVFSELTRSDLAARRGINNQFHRRKAVWCAVYLCRNVLQPIRDTFGSFTPNSVYRCQALERALKNKSETWRSTSQHVKGQACDIEIPGLPNLELAQWVQSELSFDQLILECYNAQLGPNSGWVHISLKPPGEVDNQGEVLSYIFDPTTDKYTYVTGLNESP